MKTLNIHSCTRCLLLICMLAGTVAARANDELVFLTWQDYIDPTVVSEFEQQAHCHVRFVYFDDDDERNMILANTGAQGFDLALVDHATLDTYNRNGWLTPLTYADIPNARHARNPWRRQPDPEPFNAVNYFWGGVGIVYRRDLMHAPPQSWHDIFQPDVYLQDHILLLNTVQTTFGLALKTLGYSFNSTDPRQVEAATELLMATRPFVHEFRNIRTGPDSDLLSGNIYEAVTYNGDALTLMQRDKRIKFVYPKEGTVLWLDTIVILKQAKHVALAKQFLNFINDPAVAARNSEAMFYATPNVAAQALQPKSFLADTNIYPDPDTVDHAEQFQQLPTAHLRRITTSFVQIMSQREP